MSRIQTVWRAVKNKTQQWESALFAKAPPAFSPISWPFVTLIIVIGFIIPILSVRVGAMLKMPQILITLANSVLTLLLTWGALRLKQLSFQTIGLTLKGFPKEVTIGIGLFLVLETARTLMLLVRGDVPTISTEPSVILDAAGQAFLCASAEEVFYRGLAISFLLSRLQRWDLAVLISSIIFALGHLHLGQSSLELLILTGNGVLFALLYIWRGYNLTAPIVVHTLGNFSAILRS